MKQGTNGLSYQELNVGKRAQAHLEIDKIVKNILEIPPKPYWIDRVVLECMISTIDPSDTYRTDTIRSRKTE